MSDDLPSPLSPAGRKLEAVNTVNERIDYLTEVGNAALADTENYMRDLQTLVSELEIPPIDEIRVENPQVPDLDYTERPSLEDVNLDLEAWPEKDFSLTLKSISGVSGVDFPTFNVIPPDYQIIEKPVLEEPAEPGAPPSFEGVELPSAPAITLPNVPSLDDIVLPAAPEISLPAFDARLLPWDVDDPEQFSWGEPVYGSDIWADLLAKVLENIRNGGTGLDFQVEEDLYWQHLNRTFQENERLYREAEDYFAARGFTLPPGMLSAKLNEISAQISRNNLQASKDITISQAELAQKNTQFFIEKGVQMEGMLRDFFINQANLSLQGQRAVAEHSIALHNANIQKFTYYLEEYKTKAGVWESQVRAALVSVEIFKAKVEAARVSAETQKLLIETYNAQVAAARTAMDLYVAQMQGAQLAAQVQETKMRVYAETIKAYVAKIEGNKAKIQMYEAELTGEQTKAAVFQSQVEAYAAHVAAKTQELQGQIAYLNAQIEENRGLVAEYTAKLQGYSTEVQAKATEVGAKVSGFQALAAAYQAETTRDSAYYQAKIAEINARINEAQFALQRGVALVNAAVSGYSAVKQLQLSGTTGIMGVGAQLAASAMNAINTSASISYGGSDSLNNSNSNSNSESLSEIHTYLYNMD